MERALKANAVISLILLLGFVLLMTSHAGGQERGGAVMSLVNNIHWLGHDAFRITGEKTIYTDPFRLTDGQKADIILISHEHYDHCSPGDVAKIQGPDTIVIAPPDCVEKIKGKTKAVKPGEKLNVHGIDIEVVPSYNINKKFHPKEKAWVGYVFKVNGKRIYHAGDSDYIPEMKNIKADIALLPVGGTYTMTADEAAKAALDIKPEVAIPMHYGSVVGKEADAEKFRKDLEGKINVVILKQEQ